MIASTLASVTAACGGGAALAADAFAVAGATTVVNADDWEERALAVGGSGIEDGGCFVEAMIGAEGESGAAVTETRDGGEEAKERM